MQLFPIVVFLLSKPDNFVYSLSLSTMKNLLQMHTMKLSLSCLATVPIELAYKIAVKLLSSLAKYDLSYFPWKICIENVLTCLHMGFFLCKYLSYTT